MVILVSKKRITRQTPKEQNELLEIWKEELLWHTNVSYEKARWEETLKEYHRDVFFCYHIFSKNILRFWTLKQKIDDMKKRIKDLIEYEVNKENACTTEIRYE